MISKNSHNKIKFQGIYLSIFIVLLIILPSFNLFGFTSIQNSNNLIKKNNFTENAEFNEFRIEKVFFQDKNLKIFDDRILMNFGTSSSFQVESDILLYTLGLLSSLVIVNIGVVIKKSEAKTRKQKESFESSYIYSIFNINEQEKIVLKNIQEYLKDNKQLEIDKVINQLNSTFTKSGINLNIVGIKETMRSLLEKKFIVEGSKLTRWEVLENNNRKEIYEFIKEKPGTHLMKIVRELNISNFLVRWHLDMLIKFNYIKNEKINNYEIYYDISISPEVARRNYLIMNEKCSKILRFLETNSKGTTKYQLAKNLGMHYNTLTKYISELDEHGLIFKKYCNNRILYFF